jgi:hypothetical protein
MRRILNLTVVMASLRLILCLWPSVRYRLLVPMIACLAGCATPYPTSWPVLPEQSEPCANVSGKYSAFGESPKGRSPVPFLSQFVAHSHLLEGAKGKADIFLLRADEAKLEIEFISSGGSTVYQQTHTSLCENGFTWFSYWLALEGTEFRYALGMTIRDGFLIVHIHELAAGFVVIFPVAGASETWYRYKRLEH